MTEPIQRLFESSALLAVNKPAGIASIPERGDKKDDLLTQLSAERGERLFVVHRLDKGVTGVILYAKTAAAHRILNDQFAGRTIKKTYAAIVQGAPKENAGKFDQPIRKFGSGRMGVDPLKGLPCLTHYRVAERFPAYTLLEVFPETGRRHQIRVHLFNAGIPVAGDRLYGDPRFQNAFDSILLHAREIEFETEPGKKMKISAPLPPFFTEMVAKVRALAAPLSVLPAVVQEKPKTREEKKPRA